MPVSNEQKPVVPPNISGELEQELYLLGHRHGQERRKCVAVAQGAGMTEMKVMCVYLQGMHAGFDTLERSKFSSSKR